MEAFRTFIVCILTCFAFVAGTARAEETLTWEDCVARAIWNHPDLISAAEQVKQAEAEQYVDVGSALPQVDAEFSGKRTQASSRNTRGEYTQKLSTAFDYGVTGKQLVFDGFKTSSEVSSALKTLKAGQYNYMLVSSNIRLNLRSAFVNLLKAQELIELTEDIAGRRKQNLELVRLRYEAGREHKGSLLTAEADLANAEFEIEQAKRGISLAQRELSKELGMGELIQARAKGEFSLQDAYEAKPDFERLADSTPFLKELIAKKEAARFDLHSEEADFLPEVYIDGSAGRTNDDWPPRYDEWSAGFSVSLPLFEGGSRVAEVAKARAKLRQAEAEERSGLDSVLVTLEETWKGLRDAVAYVEVQKKFLEAARERAKITSAQYETGLTTFDDWIIIEDNLASAKKSYLNAQADMLAKEAYWIQAIGGTLDYAKE